MQIVDSIPSRKGNHSGNRKVYPEGHKVCGRCNKKEGVVRFYSSRRTNVCVECENKARVANSRETPPNPESLRRWRRAYRMRLRHGMELSDYEEMLKAQNGACAICLGVPNGRDLCIDHNHETGKVRSLLCDLCNRTLGQAGDDPILLERMAAYLRFHAGDSSGGRPSLGLPAWSRV